jgi:hypothetical protein
LAGNPQWYEKTPFPEIIGGVRAILPLIVFLFIVMKLVLREKIREAGLLTYGITLAIIGMCVFNMGLTHGLARLGDQSGGLVPAAFAAIEQVPDSPLYMVSLGIGIAILFAWFLGFGATLAEPALNALGKTVQNLTNGAFKKSLLMYAVSFGVACGLALGVLKMIFDFHLAYLLLPGYTIGLVLTVLSINSIEGFGILSMASICPIISVMTVGLFVQRRTRKNIELAQGAELTTQSTRELAST